MIPLQQTAPNVNFDEFLAGLDAETRSYLQELLAGAGEGLKNNASSLSATLKRFEPAARYGRVIAQQLEARHANIARSIHNFRLLMEALGSKDKQLAQLVDASNAVFATFAQEEANLQKTLHLLPGALQEDRRRPGQARHRLQQGRSRRCTRSTRSPKRSARPTKRRGVSRSRPPRSSRTRSGPSRAKSCPWSTNWRPRQSSSAKPSRT